MENNNEQNTNNEENIPLPKHISFPEVPTNSDITNELIMFLFVLVAGAMQFLHIYRTVWWLPDSYVNHTINLYLIDPYLVIFIIVMISRRLLYCMLNKLLDAMYKSAEELKIRKTDLKYIYTNIVLVLLICCILKIYVKQTYLSLFFLLYPLLVYLLIFGFQIEPFMQMTNENKSMYLNGVPFHCCLTSPGVIRGEVDVLKNDFNSRFKQVLFTSVTNAFYAGFVPCCFAQNFLYYDVLQATQHCIFVWFGGFMMCIVFCFPAKYFDVLHRSALHLGRWMRLHGRFNNNQPPVNWSKSLLWTFGNVVKHNGELYKGIAQVIAATPGNSSQYRFYVFFRNPSIIYMALTGIQTFLVVLQILLLFFTTEWHNVLSLSFLILTNHHTLFKIVRDYLVTKKVYMAEYIYQRKNYPPNSTSNSKKSYL